MKRRATAAAGLLFAALFTGSHAARAFCRERTCDANDPKQHCQMVDNCVTSGHLLRWPTSCMSFDPQADGSPRRGLDADTVSDVVGLAFAPWLAANCGGGHPPLTVGTFGPVACDQVENPDPKHPYEYDRSKEKGANVVMFRDDVWPYTGSLDAYALTTVTYNRDTGVILDADIEVNSADFDITVGNTGTGTDLQSVLTHEVGHFLGMAHAATANLTATMRSNWDGNGTDLRTLTDDDEAGICDAYPPGLKLPSDCEPLNGLASECHVPADKPEGGCALAGRHDEGTSGANPLAVGAFVFVGLALRRRTRRGYFTRRNAAGSRSGAGMRPSSACSFARKAPHATKSSG
jgi:hypothetical protein